MKPEEAQHANGSAAADTPPAALPDRVREALAAAVVPGFAGGWAPGGPISGNYRRRAGARDAALRRR